MNGTRGYYAKLNKSIRERQLSYDFTHMCNLRNKKGVIGEGGKNKKQDKIKEGDKPLETLNHRKQTEGYWRAEGQGMG